MRLIEAVVAFDQALIGIACGLMVSLPLAAYLMTGEWDFPMVVIAVMGIIAGMTGMILEH